MKVHQLNTDATYESTVYPSGTWVVAMDQEFAQLVRELLEVQKYPELGDDLPYDAAGWTLCFGRSVWNLQSSGVRCCYCCLCLLACGHRSVLFAQSAQGEVCFLVKQILFMLPPLFENWTSFCG